MQHSCAPGREGAGREAEAAQLSSVLKFIKFGSEYVGFANRYTNGCPVGI